MLCGRARSITMMIIPRNTMLYALRIMRPWPKRMIYGLEVSRERSMNKISYYIIYRERFFQIARKFVKQLRASTAALSERVFLIFSVGVPMQKACQHKINTSIHSQPDKIPEWARIQDARRKTVGSGAAPLGLMGHIENIRRVRMSPLWFLVILWQPWRLNNTDIHCHCVF